MYITRHTNITDADVLDSLWALYEESYRPLSAKDPTREMLFRSEFDDALSDATNRITVLRDGNRPVAMSVSATDIGATRYLSREYFETHFPERMAAGRVHYVMWIVVHPDYQGGTALFELSRDGLAQEQADGALLVFDLPESNQPNDHGGGAELLFRMARMVGEVQLKPLSVNRYYALDFAPSEETVEATADDAQRVDA